MEEQRVDNLMQLENTEKRNIFYQNMFSLRTFLITLIGFSLTIIGITLSVLSSSLLNTNLKSDWLTYVGLISLGLNVVGSIGYILYIYTIEANSLYRQIKYNEAFNKKIKDLIYSVYNDPSKTSADYIKVNKEIVESSVKELEKVAVKNYLTIKGKDWTPHILCALFVLGVCLLFSEFLQTLK